MAFGNGYGNSWFDDDQGGKSDFEYFQQRARAHGYRTAGDALRDYMADAMRNAHGTTGTAAAQEKAQQANQQEQVDPVRETYWVCKRASLQGWLVKFDRSHPLRIRVIWYRNGEMMVGPYSESQKVALVQGANDLIPLLQSN